MPLQISDSDSIIGQATAPDSEAQYLFFLASGTPPWCPDCRDALPAIEKVFGKDAPVLHVILVGTRDEWKTPANRWRGSPFYVDQTPTILKLVHGKEIGRLGDQASKSEEQLRELIST